MGAACLIGLSRGWECCPLALVALLRASAQPQVSARSLGLQHGHFVVQAPRCPAKSKLEGKLPWKASEFMRDVTCETAVPQEYNKLEVMLLECPGARRQRTWMQCLGSWRTRPAILLLPTLPTPPSPVTSWAAGPAGYWAWGHLLPRVLYFLFLQWALAFSPVLRSGRLLPIGVLPVPVHGLLEDQRGEEMPTKSHLTVYWSFVIWLTWITFHILGFPGLLCFYLAFPFFRTSICKFLA